MPTLFLLLLAGHALGDYALQSDYMAKEKANSLWVLLMHALIHGGIVYFVTGSLALMAAETVLHAGIDKLKTTGRISLVVDQALHVLCKLVYVGVVFA